MTKGWAVGSRTDPIARACGALGDGAPNTLFPLPYFGALPVDSCLKGRSRRAAAKCRRLTSEVDETLWGINWLSGTAGCRGHHADSGTVNSVSSELKRDTLARVAGAVQEFVPTSETPEASLKEVLRGTGADGDSYATGGELPQGALASFRCSKLVLSDDLSSAPMAHTLLPDEVADCLNDVERMQRTSVEVAKLEAEHGGSHPTRTQCSKPRLVFTTDNVDACTSWDLRSFAKIHCAPSGFSLCQRRTGSCD